MYLNIILIRRNDKSIASQLSILNAFSCSNNQDYYEQDKAHQWGDRR